MTIFTATATNAGFYMLLVTDVADEAAARSAFGAVLSAPADEGGDYTLGNVTARHADEDGDYDLGLRSLYSAADVADELARTGADNLGHGVVLLESGANG